MPACACKLRNMRKRPVQNLPGDDPILVRASEACRLLGITDNTLRKLVKDGLIEVRYVATPGSRVPHRKVVMSSLREYVAGLPQDPPSAA